MKCILIQQDYKLKETSNFETHTHKNKQIVERDGIKNKTTQKLLFQSTLVTETAKIHNMHKYS